MRLAIDIETYSSFDLTKTGVYKYVEAPDFEVLMLAYDYGDDRAGVIDFSAPGDVWDMVKADLLDQDIIKTAWNANFERVCLAKFLGDAMPPQQWECSMVKAAYCGLPFGLDAASKVLNLTETKDSAGKMLIKYFSMPCKPTKINGGRTRNLPHHSPEKWNAFKAYCLQDVRTEQAVLEKLESFKIPNAEKELWDLDQRINDKGVLIDLQFAKAAIAVDESVKSDLIKKAIEITGLENPNSVGQLKDWLEVETGEYVYGLTKKDLPELMQSTNSPEAKEVLSIRQQLAKSSVKKYAAMISCACDDGRARGLFQFYGANRTGRWSGRLIQLQNLPQNHMANLELARDVVGSVDAPGLYPLFDNIPDVLSQLIRTAFIAPPGLSFLVADFSAIEARVIAWLAGEKWRLDVFAGHGKIYEASAAKMFRIPIEEITKGSTWRQRGKVAELALGYQGGPGALKAMGAIEMGITEDELKPIVAAWRRENPAIVGLWYRMQSAAIDCLLSGERVDVAKGVAFETHKGFLQMLLPSGRKLNYPRAKVIDGKYGPAVVYQGVDQATKRWSNTDTYGGKLVENCIQAIARDCLGEAMLRLDKAGYGIVMTVHDEVVIEYDEANLHDVIKIMSEPIKWAPGLSLKADGFTTKFYKKDD